MFQDLIEAFLEGQKQMSESFKNSCAVLVLCIAQVMKFRENLAFVTSR